MRIAHVTATFPPYHGGTGTVCYNNAIHTANKGHDVHVYTAQYTDDPQYEDPPQIEVHRLDAVMQIGNAPLLPDLLRIKAIDLIHLHYPFYFGQEFLYFKSFVPGIPYVITYHQDVLLPGIRGIIATTHHQTLGRLILQRAARLFVTSMDYGQHARIAPIVKRMRDRVLEMPNGVDPERFHPAISGAEIRERHQIDGNAPVVLFVGGLDTPHFFKGVDVLLQSFANVADPRARLVLVGDGDLRPTYQQTAQNLGLAEKVVFAGRVSDAELPLYYAMCDLLVLPSTTMGEAFGVVSLEAMACAKPVIASNLPGVRSVVSDQESGFLVEPSNVSDLTAKLDALLGDKSLRESMGAQGRKRVEEKYAWPQIVERLTAAYRDVLYGAR